LTASIFGSIHRIKIKRRQEAFTFCDITYLT